MRADQLVTHSHTSLEKWFQSLAVFYAGTSGCRGSFALLFRRESDHSAVAELQFAVHQQSSSSTAHLQRAGSTWAGKKVPVDMSGSQQITMCKVVPGKNLGILRFLVNDTKSFNTGVLNLWVATPLGVHIRYL